MFTAFAHRNDSSEQTMIAAALIVHCLLLQSVQSRSNRYTYTPTTAESEGDGTVDDDRQRGTRTHTHTRCHGFIWNFEANTKSIYFIFHFKVFDIDAVERQLIPELLHEFRDKMNHDPTNDDEDKNKFYEVDAHGDDYVDFGALTGQNGAFSWHANFPLE